MSTGSPPTMLVTLDSLVLILLPHVTKRKGEEGGSIRTQELSLVGLGETPLCSFSLSPAQRSLARQTRPTHKARHGCQGPVWGALMAACLQAWLPLCGQRRQTQP